MVTLSKTKSTIFSNAFAQAIVVSAVFTSTTYALALAFGWISADGVNFFEIGAGAFNYIATYLCIKQKRSYALIGIAGSGLWAYVFFTNDLLASAVVNAYLALMLVYGWWRWGKDSNSRKVRHLSLKWTPVYLGVTVLIYLGAVWITDSLGGEFAFWDAAILVLTILAQLLQDQKIITVWIVWTLVNIVGVILYFNSELYFAMIQQIIFGLANVLGWREWSKTMKEESK